MFVLLYPFHLFHSFPLCPPLWQPEVCSLCWWMTTIIISVFQDGRCTNPTAGVSYKTSLCSIPLFPNPSLVVPSFINWVDFLCSEKIQEFIFHVWASYRLCLQKACVTWTDYKHRFKVPTFGLADFSGLRKIALNQFLLLSIEAPLIWNKDPTRIYHLLTEIAVCISYSPTEQSKLMIVFKVLGNIEFRCGERNWNVSVLVDLWQAKPFWWT